MGRGRLPLAIASGLALACLSFGAPSSPIFSAAVSPEVVPAFRDATDGVSFVVPRGWVAAPSSSLDRGTDEQAYEIARYQLHVGDPALYAQPIPVTSGLLDDAGAVISIALAREGSALASIDLSAFAPDDVTRVPGASAVDSETSYEGVATLTRILVARGTHRVAIVRAYVPLAQREALGAPILSAISSASVAADGPSGAAYVAPAPPAPATVPAAGQVAAASVTVSDPSAVARAEIVARASLMLGTPYVWGGDAPGVGMDCSAYVSAAWGVARYTTDSIWDVAVPIAKADLLPGDAMDLETWRDPDGYGHIRLFDAWANTAHSLVWVYEETPSRAIHRVIAYDDSYTPMRLAGLSGDGAAPVVPAPAPQPTVARPERRYAPPTRTRPPERRRAPAPAGPRAVPTRRPAVQPHRTDDRARHDWYPRRVRAPYPSKGPLRIGKGSHP